MHSVGHILLFLEMFESNKFKPRNERRILIRVRFPRNIVNRIVLVFSADFMPIQSWTTRGSGWVGSENLQERVGRVGSGPL